MQPAAIREARIDHGSGTIDPQPERCDCPLDGGYQMLIGFELDVGSLQWASSIDPNLVRAVDQHVSHIRVVNQLLNRAQSDYVGDHPMSGISGTPGRLEGQHSVGLGFDDFLSQSAVSKSDRPSDAIDYAHGRSQTCRHAAIHWLFVGSLPLKRPRTRPGLRRGRTGPGPGGDPAAPAGCHTADPT